ncbi:hypothetical protein NIES39_L01310 [Arthrospira platensis NIES-39]|jgi:hypothetical protein|nr:hypothetical protein NIES39_L01310 [Arthrospira platensis NIES-39]
MESYENYNTIGRIGASVIGDLFSWSKYHSGYQAFTQFVRKYVNGWECFIDGFWFGGFDLFS